MSSELYLLIGIAIGFVLGHVHRALRVAREDMDAFQRGMGAGMAVARAERIVLKDPS